MLGDPFVEPGAWENARTSSAPRAVQKVSRSILAPMPGDPFVEPGIWEIVRASLSYSSYSSHSSYSSNIKPD